MNPLSLIINKEEIENLTTFDKIKVNSSRDSKEIDETASSSSNKTITTETNNLCQEEFLKYLSKWKYITVIYFQKLFFVSSR